MLNKYQRWALEQAGKRLFACLILLPFLIVFFPFYKVGELLGRAFYRLIG